MIEIEVFGIRDEEPTGVCSYALPLVAIEGKVCFNGGISNSRIYEEISNKIV